MDPCYGYLVATILNHSLNQSALKDNSETSVHAKHGALATTWCQVKSAYNSLPSKCLPSRFWVQFKVLVLTKPLKALDPWTLGLPLLLCSAAKTSLITAKTSEGATLQTGKIGNCLFKRILCGGSHFMEQSAWSYVEGSHASVVSQNA